MSGWALDVRAAPERRGSVAAWLVARTGHAVLERPDGTLVGFADSEGAAEAVLAELRAGAASTLEASRRALPPVDWSTRWREGLAPRRIGALTVTPSWIPVPDPPGPVIVLDPENAFGSGEHGSTRSALALLERWVRPGDRVLDLGSGSGILAIAAAALGAARATGIELDPDAVAVAERNAARNGVAGRTAFLEGDAAVLAPLLGPADLILSNIFRRVNLELLPAVLAALAPGGTVIFAGMEEDEAPVFLPALDPAGLEPAGEAIDAGWWAVAARRR